MDLDEQAFPGTRLSDEQDVDSNVAHIRQSRPNTRQSRPTLDSHSQHQTVTANIRQSRMKMVHLDEQALAGARLPNEEDVHAVRWHPPREVRRAPHLPQTSFNLQPEIAGFWRAPVEIKGLRKAI